MQQVKCFLNGELNYANISGDTGPIVYPAGHLYIYSILYFLTNQGTSIRLGQYFFVILYIFNLVAVFNIYNQVRKVKWFAVCFSHRQIENKCFDCFQHLNYTRLINFIYKQCLENWFQLGHEKTNSDDVNFNFVSNLYNQYYQLFPGPSICFDDDVLYFIPNSFNILFETFQWSNRHVCSLLFYQSHFIPSLEISCFFIQVR